MLKPQYTLEKTKRNFKLEPLGVLLLVPVREEGLEATVRTVIYCETTKSRTSGVGNCYFHII